MIHQQLLNVKMEIIHIDSGSTDGTPDVAAAFNLTTRYIRKADFNHSRTRNYAVAIAQHEIVVFLSQDAIPYNDCWLARLVAHFADPTVGAVYGRQIPPKGISPVRQCTMEYLYPNKREVRDPSLVQNLNLSMLRFSNANCAIRKDLLRALRFDERALVCEDHGMCRDILSKGYKVIYEPEAAVLHGHDRSLYSEFQWAVDNGISLARMGILGTRSSARTEIRYGLQCTAQQVKQFLRQHDYGHVATCLIFNLLRWFGVQLGKREAQLPSSILQFISPRLRQSLSANHT
jgi:rhamnosyltransferase